LFIETSPKRKVKYLLLFTMFVWELFQITKHEKN